jgi:hypothetical protein
VAVLGESERWLVEETRDLMGRWDPDLAEGRERVLAHRLRALLALVDPLAPAGDDSGSDQAKL